MPDAFASSQLVPDAAKKPPIRWIQRAHFVYLFFDVPSATHVAHNLSDDGMELSFICKDESEQLFGVHMGFYDAVKAKVEGPTASLRYVQMGFAKKKKGEWPRLTAQPQKLLPYRISYDWGMDNTIDSDDSVETSSSSSDDSVCHCADERQKPGRNRKSKTAASAGKAVASGEASSSSDIENVNGKSDPPVRRAAKEPLKGHSRLPFTITQLLVMLLAILAGVCLAAVSWVEVDLV